MSVIFEGRVSTLYNDLIATYNANYEILRRAANDVSTLRGEICFEVNNIQTQLKGKITHTLVSLQALFEKFKAEYKRLGEVQEQAVLLQKQIDDGIKEINSMDFTPSVPKAMLLDPIATEVIKKAQEAAKGSLVDQLREKSTSIQTVITTFKENFTSVDSHYLKSKFYEAWKPTYNFTASYKALLAKLENESKTNQSASRSTEKQ